MSKFTKYFKDELVGKLFSSKKKIVKFVAICWVPFLYGFVCVSAFWDPVANIGEVPMAIVDNSKRINLAVGTELEEPAVASAQPKVIIGEADLSAPLDDKGYPTQIRVKQLNSSGNWTGGYTTQKINCFSYKPDFSFIESFIKGWTTTDMSDPIISQNPNGTFNIEVSESTPLNNVSYFNNYNTGTRADSIANYDPHMTNPVTGKTGAWYVDNENYWLQIQVPESFNEIFAYTLSSMYMYSKANPPQEENGESWWWDQLGQLSNTPINIWTTFKKNFLFGQFMKVFNELKSSMVVDFYPRLIVQTLVNLVSSITSDKC